MKIPIYAWALLFLLGAGFSSVLAYTDDPNVLPGTWQGKLKKPVELRMVFRIEKFSNGTYGGKMDSPDEGLKNIPISRIVLHNGHVRLEVNTIGGVYEGEILSGQNKIDGVWTKDGSSWPLVLEKLKEKDDWARPQDPQGPFPFEQP
ncbi:MAG TPA: hypothetical protein GX391_03760 [Firmicutes bacterium]|jgi:hypothetical protein|nr:hypothetical protein [Bacillota bacterium]HOQ23325.1 hypothetical protein [Bacillota bacterium]HPT66745.1 hypothetical protein [Bacillota bacterium]